MINKIAHLHGASGVGYALLAMTEIYFLRGIVEIELTVSPRLSIPVLKHGSFWQFMISLWQLLYGKIVTNP
jgi:hypothetical protein